MVIEREYQPMSALSGTPESGAPHEKGTRISRDPARAPLVQPARSPSLRASKANRQDPFRFTHPERAKSGRGCSGSGIVAAAGVCAHNAPVPNATQLSLSNRNPRSYTRMGHPPAVLRVLLRNAARPFRAAMLLLELMVGSTRRALDGRSGGPSRTFPPR